MHMKVECSATPPSSGFLSGKPPVADCLGVQAVMRMRSGDLGNLWVPVFDGAADGKPGEVYWPVGVAGRELVCIICSAAARHPRVSLSPVLFAFVAGAAAGPECEKCRSSRGLR